MLRVSNPTEWNTNFSPSLYGLKHYCFKGANPMEGNFISISPNIHLTHGHQHLQNLLDNCELISTDRSERLQIDKVFRPSENHDVAVKVTKNATRFYVPYSSAVEESGMEIVAMDATFKVSRAKILKPEIKIGKIYGTSGSGPCYFVDNSNLTNFGIPNTGASGGGIFLNQVLIGILSHAGPGQIGSIIPMVDLVNFISNIKGYIPPLANLASRPVLEPVNPMPQVPQAPQSQPTIIKADGLDDEDVRFVKSLRKALSSLSK